ncbi:unnamed protein product, partial [Hapterophycus canaliculatus]
QSLFSTFSTKTTSDASSAAGHKNSSGWRRVRPGQGGVPAGKMGSVGYACLAMAAAAAAVAAAAASSRQTRVMAADSTRPSAAASTTVPVAPSDEEEEEDNASLVAAAHELRRALTPPQQSLFRVVCILVYEDFSGRLHRITGEYLFSCTNAESSTIGGSICAERAAMCKLREASDCKRVTKVVVVTDNPGPLAPGVLCREFLSTHLAPSTPVVMSGSGNDGSSSVVLGGLLYEEADLRPSSRAGLPSETTECDAGGSSNSNSDVAVPLAVPAAAPGRVPPATSTCGHRAAVGGDGAPSRAGPPPAVLMSAPTGDPCGLLSSAARGEDEEGGEGGDHGRGGASASVDVCSVGDLYPWRNLYGVRGRGEQLRLGFLAQQAAEEISKPGLSEKLGLESGVLEAYDAAWRATAEDDRDGVHPIRYASVALFPDGEAEITHQV